MTSVLIVPGLGGSGQEHWQSHWERALSDAHRVQQRDWDHPNLTEWSYRLAHAVEQRPGAILVGHSLDSARCTRVARLAHRRGTACRAGRCRVTAAYAASHVGIRAVSAHRASVSSHGRGEQQRSLHEPRARACSCHRLARRFHQSRPCRSYQRQVWLRSVARR